MAEQVTLRMLVGLPPWIASFSLTQSTYIANHFSANRPAKVTLPTSDEPFGSYPPIRKPKLGAFKYNAVVDLQESGVFREPSCSVGFGSIGTL
jgi:hypothetical protein